MRGDSIFEGANSCRGSCFRKGQAVSLRPRQTSAFVFSGGGPMERGLSPLQRTNSLAGRGVGGKGAAMKNWQMIVAIVLTLASANVATAQVGRYQLVQGEWALLHEQGEVEPTKSGLLLLDTVTGEIKEVQEHVWFDPTTKELKWQRSLVSFIMGPLVLPAHKTSEILDDELTVPKAEGKNGK